MIGVHIKGEKCMYIPEVRFITRGNNSISLQWYVYYLLHEFEIVTINFM